MASNELALTSFLADPVIRSMVKSKLDPWMLQDPAALALYEILIDIEGRPATETLVTDIKCKNTEHQVEIIKNVRLLPTVLTGDDVDMIVKNFEKFIQDKMFTKAVSTAIDSDLQKALPLLREAGDFSMTYKKVFDFSLKEDRNLAKTAEGKTGAADIITSKYSVINASLTYGGHKRGQVIMIVGDPKRGKSTFMLNESSHMAFNGLKVLHIFLGDMSEYDGLVRFISCMANEMTTNVVHDHESYITPEVERALANIRVASFAAYELGVDDLVGYAKRVHEEFPFDCVVVDYDGNLKEALDPSLYHGGGYSYSQLHKLARNLNCLTYVGCQTKIDQWGVEILPSSSAADSSKKQHAIDAMICLGQNAENDTIGSVHMPLVRRGISGVVFRVQFAMSVGRINEITDDMYTKLLTTGTTSTEDISAAFQGKK